MNRISCVIIIVLLAGIYNETASGADSFRTEWRVTPAEGMDALLLLGAATGDEMQAEYYAESIEYFRSRMTDEGLAALDELGTNLRGKGLLVGPSLAYFFSAGNLDSIDDVIASAADPVGLLKPGLQTSPHWDTAEFDAAVRMMPLIHSALIALRDSGFQSWYASTQLPIIREAVEQNLAAVQDFDIIPEQERLLGRQLDPNVEIIIVNFTRPYGIRILGQRFVAYYGWEAETQLRVAAHEIFHPPFDPNDEDLPDLLDDLRNDAWMISIVENHDPKYGYNRFMGVVNEGSTQALDQVVADRLGFAEDPGERWRESDGGMHMLAAALYHAMIEDGFAAGGGNYSDWFKSALRRGLLDPDDVRSRATTIVGADVVNSWYDKAAAVSSNGAAH